MPSNTKSQIKRVFLGFALDSAQTDSITAIQAQLPSSVRLVPSANLHMTLAFLGAATPEQLTALIQKVNQLHKPQFSVTLNTLSHWAKPKILCLRGHAEDIKLLQLAQDTQHLAAELGLHCSEHHYNPHITLSRKAKAEVNGIDYQALTLAPTELHLFESCPSPNGVEYPTLHSWKLGAL
ncbi:RNA 2',3'-cyclic phosphodiesterase [Shewanella schlegeliana]|uniref:RNA 2',3'-cyclic phosphodiesterase n=1 Tax=Shewanella schlegeliana TaxID=190308 RepID=A0ABS1SX75_9GAMM|nr:RNA 2',3'-cyclic phosphodiesterase [Shewanella schlegeliana]MBL4912499.1 RNA 2',3'-cyclic phosphodiesterase [Shewanella schlegeliana]MCL1108031.1 RNA 2',3'-cyclic phosphodiesterase [Shewanella schlegeliana]GIU21488.1 RNA 2',3'-cyclic phosphodiesterase [Shewanella schlegeliana]